MNYLSDSNLWNIREFDYFYLSNYTYFFLLYSDCKAIYNTQLHFRPLLLQQIGDIQKKLLLIVAT